MIGFDVRGNVNFAKNADIAKKKAVKAFAMQLAKESDPYVRYQTGTMARTVRLSDFNNGHITYDTTYAKATYYDENSKPTKDIHPLACAKWVEVALNAKKDRLLNFFKKQLMENI